MKKIFSFHMSDTFLAISPDMGGGRVMVMDAQDLDGIMKTLV